MGLRSTVILGSWRKLYGGTIGCLSQNYRLFVNSLAGRRNKGETRRIHVLSSIWKRRFAIHRTCYFFPYRSLSSCKFLPYRDPLLRGTAEFVVDDRSLQLPDGH